jgi:hypothetical protein
MKPALSASATAVDGNQQVSQPAGGRANLLQEIQQGKALRKIGAPAGDKAPVPTNPPTLRDNMMEQIKQGTNLKHVQFSKNNITVE